MNMAFALAAAAGLGALHSLEPGHGKGVLTAYLISTRARTLDAVVLGVVSALSHALSIFVLSIATLSAAHSIMPNQMLLWTELLSGLVIATIGARMIYLEKRPQTVVVGKLGCTSSTGESCGHGHHHHHHFGHSHHHSDSAQALTEHRKPASYLRLASIGFFAGLIPCPSAMAILLAAIGADRIPTGIGLVGAFSAGSAAAMCSVGILAVNAGSFLSKLETRRFVRWLGSMSSLLIFLLGGFVAIQSLLRLGL